MWHSVGFKAAVSAFKGNCAVKERSIKLCLVTHCDKCATKPVVIFLGSLGHWNETETLSYEGCTYSPQLHGGGACCKVNGRTSIIAPHFCPVRPSVRLYSWETNVPKQTAPDTHSADFEAIAVIVTSALL